MFNMLSPCYQRYVYATYIEPVTNDCVLDLCVRRDSEPIAEPIPQTSFATPYGLGPNFEYRDPLNYNVPDGAINVNNNNNNNNYGQTPAPWCAEGYNLIPQQQPVTEPVVKKSPSENSEPHNSAPSASPETSPLPIPMLLAAAIGQKRGGKPTRPFKAYPKDPLALASGIAESILGESNKAYEEYREKMLAQVKAATGTTAGNRNMKRTTAQPKASPEEIPSSSGDSPPEGNAKLTKDEAYWEKRRKNNEAAKRSRDARRAKEDEIAIRAAYLEQENLKLKYELAAARTEAAQLRRELDKKEEQSNCSNCNKELKRKKAKEM